MRPDVSALREAIDARLRGRAAFSEQTYGDQPIVFSGRQLKSYVPEPISQARALARSPEMRHHSEAYVFWQQAKLLADFEDDYEFHGHFSRYFPTYEVMNNDQLRGYFSWRTSWRRGEAAPTEASFVYVCAYELLQGIGAPDARACHEALGRLRDDYAGQDVRMAQNLARWMDDFVVYWGLPAELLGPLSHREEDAALASLIGWQACADDELFGAMARLSSYRVADSAFYKRHPDELRRVACATYRGVAAHHDRSLKHSLAQAYFGVSVERDYPLLPNAVFADPRPQEAVDFEVSPLDHIRCRAGRWSRDRYQGNLRPNKKLGALIKTVDATMREAYGFSPSLVAPLKTKYVLELARKGTEALLAEQAEARRRAVHIDLTKLGGIRAAADITRDRLIVEEEADPVALPGLEAVAPARPAPVASVPEECQPVPVPVPASAPAPVVPRVAEEPARPVAAPVPREPLGSDVSGAAAILTEDERALLELLLSHGDLRAWERERHVMASLLIESVNEKLMDELGDVAIDAGVEPPEVYEDYLDEVGELLHG